MADATNTNTNEETIGIELPTNFEQITQDELYVKILRDYSDKEHDVLMSRTISDSSDFLYPVTRVENVVDNGGKGLDKILAEMNIDKKAVIDIVYPVGSYYETTNISFNPNVSWTGTTWEQEDDGSVLISNDSSYSVGSIVGTNSVSLSENNIPMHRHTYDKTIKVENHILTIDEIPSHSHEVGAQLRIWGTSEDATLKMGYQTRFDDSQNVFKYSTESTGENSGHTHNVVSDSENTSYVGNGNEFSIMQKSKVIMRWHRIA